MILLDALAAFIHVIELIVYAAMTVLIVLLVFIAAVALTGLGRNDDNF